MIGASGLCDDDDDGKTVHLVEKLLILSEKFCFKFIPDKGCQIQMQNDLFWIRLQIHYTGYNNQSIGTIKDFI